MSSVVQEAISDRLDQVRKRLTEAALEANRVPGEVTLVGISKTKPPEDIVASIIAGLKHLGENRVQEAETKLPLVKSRLDQIGSADKSVTWHMVGKLQSNKARKAVALFDVIQSVDSLKLARKLSLAAAEIEKKLTVFIEVNSSGEASKGGIPPDAVIDFVAEAADLPALRVRGLMTVGPLTKDESKIRRSFVRMMELNHAIIELFPDLSPGWELSMGMSGDYKIAIRSGATMVRIGTAIFGERNYNELNR